jgi:hypothetical protein
MRRIIFLLCLWSTAAFAFEPSVLHGPWAAHQQRTGQPDRYFFLTVQPDLSGVLVRTRKGERITRTFSPDDTRTGEAYLEVSLPADETAILWAWRQSNGRHRVNGLLFEEGRAAPVRNMLPVPLEYLGPDHALRRDPIIGELLETYPFRGTVEKQPPRRTRPIGDL